MRLPPQPRRHLIGGRRRVYGMVNPAVPSRPDDRGLRQTFVDHPAPLEAEHWIDSASLRAVIAVAIFVFAHQLAVTGGPCERIEGRAVPPGKETDQEFPHSHVSDAPCLSLVHRKKPTAKPLMPPEPTRVHSSQAIVMRWASAESEGPK